MEGNPGDNSIKIGKEIRNKRRAWILIFVFLFEDLWSLISIFSLPLILYSHHCTNQMDDLNVCWSPCSICKLVTILSWKHADAREVRSLSLRMKNKLTLSNMLQDVYLGELICEIIWTYDLHDRIFSIKLGGKK